jgi:hypothetical protein
MVMTVTPRRWLAGALGMLGVLALSGPLAAQQQAPAAGQQASRPNILVIMGDDIG